MPVSGARQLPIILVLNGGDQLLPGALRTVSDHYRAHAWRWAFGGIQGRQQDGRPGSKYIFSPFSLRAFRGGIRVVPHPSAYVTRSLHEQIGLYREDLGISADQEFFLRASIVAHPGLLPGILASFELGGVSSQQGPIRREIDWHRIRMTSGTAFGGSAATDGVATALLLARQFVVWARLKLRKRE